MMKLCNEIITVFNRRVDVENGWDVYVPTVINGVSWYSHIRSIVGEKGLKAADEFIVRIPTDADFGDKMYVQPIEYRKAFDVSGLFTFDEGDVVVKGAVESSGISYTPSALKEAFTDCFTILGATDNRRAPNAPHFRVVGS